MHHCVDLILPSLGHICTTTKYVQQPIPIKFVNIQKVLSTANTMMHLQGVGVIIVTLC